MTENRRREQVSARQAYSAHGHAETELPVVNLEILFQYMVCFKDLNGEIITFFVNIYYFI